jgi:hypothetical protein
MVCMLRQNCNCVNKHRLVIKVSSPLPCRMKGRILLHRVLSVLPIPSFKRTTLRSLSTLISLTSLTSHALQTDLGEFFSPSHTAHSLIYTVFSSAFQTEALEEFLSILRPSFMRKPRSLITKPRHRLDVADHHTLNSRDLTTPPGIQDIHVEPDARWFSSSLLCAYSAVSIFHSLIKYR